METVNTKAEYLLQDVTFEHEDAHLAYTLGSGAASKMNEAYLFKSEDITLTEDEQSELESISKSLGVSPDDEKADALSVSKSQNADTGEDNKETLVTDKVELSKSEHADLLKKLERLEQLEIKEAEDLKKGKEDIVKSATFIEDSTVVVEALIKSEDAPLIESLIVKAVEAINKAKEDVRVEMQSKVDEAINKAKEAKEESELAKSEFAKPEAVEGDNSSLEDTEKDVKKSAALSDFIKANY